MPTPDPLPASPAPPPPDSSSGITKFDAARMTALAQVAGGVAPSLSDLLTVIRGQAGWLLNDTEGDPRAQECLSQVYAAAEKAVSLLRQLLIFSQQLPMRPETLALNGRIDELAGVLRRIMGDAIAVEFRLAADLPLIVADPDMIEQLLLILAQNARDAMPAGGRLTITTAVEDCADDLAKSGPDRAAGRTVLLTVGDTGSGIAPEIMPRIFEPFFTTKAAGRTVGLGLATVWGIVQQHHGRMTVDSVVNAGSSFKVFLPSALPGTVVAAGGGPGVEARAGHETILLVEDDLAVREFTVAVLQERGYRVLQAGSGTDALEVWQWHAPRVRLLLTDLVLEDAMTGLELAARLRADNPALKVICTSGHGRETMQRFPELSGGYKFLQKPCRPQALVAAVRALLDDKPT